MIYLYLQLLPYFPCQSSDDDDLFHLCDFTDLQTPSFWLCTWRRVPIRHRNDAEGWRVADVVHIMWICGSGLSWKGHKGMSWSWIFGSPSSAAAMITSITSMCPTRGNAITSFAIKHCSTRGDINHKPPLPP